jgi:TIR domain
MEIATFSIGFVHWQAIPEICKPGTLKPAFQFLADPKGSYPPANLPIVKPVGRVVPISSQARNDLDHTKKFWSIVQSRYPVQIVPSLGIGCSLPNVTLSSVQLRVLIHSFGLITSFLAEVETHPLFSGQQLAEFVYELERGQSLRSECHAMKKSANVRTLLKQVRDLLIPEMLNITPAPLHRDASTFRPFCILGLKEGNFPKTKDELDQSSEAKLQIHATLERATTAEGEVVDNQERYVIGAGGSAGTAVDTGWMFSSMNGIATYIRGSAKQADAKLLRSRTCHFHNLTAVTGLYRLYYSFVAAGLLTRQLVQEQHLVHGTEVLGSFRKEYPRWGIRWSIGKLKAHERVNNLLGDSSFGTGSTYKLFICYAHEDVEWLSKLRKMLGFQINEQRILLLNDHEIKPGTEWDPRIKGWLDSANAAVLFVSSSFFNSEYISKNELPAILTAKEDRGLRVYWVLVGSALWDRTPLKDVQSADTSLKPWADLPPAEQDKKVSELADKILREIEA